MIGSLRGKLLSRSPSDVIVEAGGVGYRVNVPLNALSSLPTVGTEVFLHIYTHVREDAFQLYGFPSEEEKRIFVTLLGVTGIGPRLALNIVSGIKHDDFLRAVESEDITMLTRVPGLGKKTAQRMVLELRGKLPREGAPAGDRIHDDALSALVNLGYKKSHASEALQWAAGKGHEEIEPLLKDALKYLTGEASEKG